MRYAFVLWVAACGGDKTTTPTTTVDDADTDTDADADSDSDTDADTDADADTGDTATTTTGYVIPPPGGGPCRDIEPNDDPNTASPCGTVVNEFGQGGLYLDPPNPGHCDPTSDPVDWLSFATQGGVEDLHQFAYWGVASDVLDFTIWEVDPSGTSITQVADYSSTDPNGEPPGFLLTDVSPMTWYLIEIRAKAGGDYFL